MTGTDRKSRLRVTIDAVPLVIQPANDDVSDFDPQRPTELVTALRPTRAERSEGMRRFEIVVDGWLFEAKVEPAARADLRERVAREAAQHHATSGVTLRAQIPGRIVRVWVAAGETVEAGQRLLAIEAMKMENEIRAPQAGVIESVSVEVGAAVERGAELVVLG